MQRILELPKILLTKGSDGIAIYEDNVLIEMPATQDKIVDIKGVGEAMMATMGFFIILLNYYNTLCLVQK